MINAGVILTSSWRLIFGVPVIALGLTGKSLSYVKWELMEPSYSEEKRQFSVRNGDILLNTEFPHKW